MLLTAGLQPEAKYKALLCGAFLIVFFGLASRCFTLKEGS